MLEPLPARGTDMKPFIRASGLMALGAVLAFSRPVPAADLVGTYQQGSYGFNGDSIRFFAFTFKGVLSGQNVDIARFQVVAELERTNSTAIRVVKSYHKAHPTPTSLKDGEVFVFGWWNTSKKTYGWIAADRNSAVFPIHRWLSSDNGNGVLDTSTGEKYICREWRMDGRHAATFELDAAAGWLSWYATAAGD